MTAPTSRGPSGTTPDAATSDSANRSTPTPKSHAPHAPSTEPPSSGSAVADATVARADGDTLDEALAQRLTDHSRRSRQSALNKKQSLRAQKKARAREQILNAAERLINAQGYARTKMRDIASAADMSYQTLYNYFPTKGLILQELLTLDLARLHDSTELTLNSDTGVNSKLRELTKAYIDAIAPQDRPMWKEACAELLKVTSFHSCLLDLLDENALEKFEQLLEEGQQRQQLDPHVDKETLAGLIFSLLDASLMRYLVNENMTRASMLSTLSAQLRLGVAPYLLSRS